MERFDSDLPSDAQWDDWREENEYVLAGEEMEREDRVVRARKAQEPDPMNALELLNAAHTMANSINECADALTQVATDLTHFGMRQYARGVADLAYTLRNACQHQHEFLRALRAQLAREAGEL
jgi:hypothetical protein